MSFRATVPLWAVLIACGQATPDPQPPVVTEVCTNGQDDNGDGKTDCSDPGCASHSFCVVGTEDCSNGRDDDGNGKTDCADPGCSAHQACISQAEVCTGGKDEDQDGKTDCADPDCFSASVCRDSGTPVEANCTDSLDNDGDGLKDCQDPDCAAAPSCQAVENCTNGLDDDGDGKADCLDSDCEGKACAASGCTCQGGAKKETACGDSQDNDGDSKADCLDTDCAAAPNCATEVGKCNDGLDNDNDQLTDCADVNDCNGASCGPGCECGGGVKKELACGDQLDNDNDTKRDCEDPDCVGVGTEICNDGVDNTCDRAIDCGDSKCTGNAACAAIQDGEPCTADGQCAGGKCLSEASTGAPNGACSNATSCNATAQTGCNGGMCVAGSSFNICRKRCTGTGLGTTGKCRAGYACLDTDTNTQNANNVCVPLCTADAECGGAGTNYGCNPWSKVCQAKDKGLGKYGAACTSPAQCESGMCSTAYPGGYCLGPCAGNLKACGGDGVCWFDSSYGDNVGLCYDGCTGSGSSQCRSSTYTCQTLSTGGSVCICRTAGSGCTSSSQCCSGSCFLWTCD